MLRQIYIGDVAAGVTVIGLPFGIGLGAVDAGAAECSGICSAFIKKYRKRIQNNTERYETANSAIAALEMKW